MVLPGYKLKKILESDLNKDEKPKKKKRKIISLRLIINNDNIAYLEFQVKLEPNNTPNLVFNSRQTLPSTMEFQAFLPLE